MINKLRKVLKQVDAVLFIGSGVSLWSGLPGWTALIGELADFIKAEGSNPDVVLREMKQGNLLQAASYGFYQLTKQQIATFIRQSCGLGKAAPHEIHHKIVSLGPTCYVTTNYDKLLELSFQKWLQGTFFSTVLNTQLVETANIVGATAAEFLFKLHGDCESSESIILTREQYGKLNPGGELNHALETVKTLMVSRPFIYIGFGLKDPDFNYLQDLLNNTYKGGARDHYAIMADVSELEIEYWRRTYGVHLIGYQTEQTAEGKTDHSAILQLLDELLIEDNPADEPAGIVNAAFILTLMRYASKYTLVGDSNEAIPLVVQLVSRNKQRDSQDFNFYQFNGAPIEYLLNQGPDKLILKGAPGSGKSFAIKKSVAHFADLLFKACLEGTFNPLVTVVPIFADLKLYKGNLEELIEQNLPAGVRLNFLLDHFKVKFFLDAFNEIPREFIESKAWALDLSRFLAKIAAVPVIISSRTEEGMDNIDFPLFELNLIGEEFLSKKLSDAGLEIKGVFASEVITILRRPFFYRLVFVSGFHISDDTTPNKIYADLLKLIGTRFQERFTTTFDFLPSLSDAAMQAMDQGEEAFKADILKSSLAQQLHKNKQGSPEPNEIINWLVSQGFVFPYTNERISFFHQSVTEYLASLRLAAMFAKTPAVLKEKLSFKRWDQALFLTMGLLKSKDAELFFKKLISIDIDLAASAVKYMEGNTEEITDRFLTEIHRRIVKHPDFSYDGQNILYKLPVTAFHIPRLKALAALGNVVGSEAVEILLDFLGEAYKAEAIDLMVSRWEDSNFGSAVGNRLKTMINPVDIPYLQKLAAQVQARQIKEPDIDFSGFVEAISGMVSKLEPYLVYKSFYDPAIAVPEQQIQIDILQDFLWQDYTTSSLKISLDLLGDGMENASIAISFISGSDEEENKIDFSVVSQKHIDILIAIIKRGNDHNTSFAFTAVKNICTHRADFSETVSQIAEKESGILKIALLYMADLAKHQMLIFDLFGKLAELSPKALKKEPIYLVSQMGEIVWTGQEKLFSQLLKIRNVALATELCETVTQYRDDKIFPVLEIGSIFWWLDWFQEFNKEELEAEVFNHAIGKIITTKVSIEKRNEFVREFNNPDSAYRATINTFILPAFDMLEIGELTDDSVQYLVDELKMKYDEVNGSILEKIATESFVSDRLLPLVKTVKGKHLRNVKTVIDKIGENFGRRYLIE